MAWYADFEHLDYFDGFADVDTTMLRAVGWLAHGHEFKQSGVDLAAVDKLSTLLVSPWQPDRFLGGHRCDICPGSGHVRPPTGFNNLFVPAEKCVYVAPELLLHYIKEHRYKPPDEFIRAVLDCPPTTSAEYLQLLRDLGFWHPRAFSFGDNVRVLPTPATVGLAGLVGLVVGQSEPSLAKVQVHFLETGLSLWLSEQVLELVD
jgi:hypothetical protein